MKKNSIAEIYEKARNGAWVDNNDLSYLVRQALKRAFPGVKFSVRNPHGGSINVGWTDGPTTKQVQQVIGCFETKSFDGMIDLAFSKGFWLYADGSCSHAVCEGTEGSGGVVNHTVGSSLRGDGVLVTNVSGCYVFENRQLSAELLNRSLEKLKAKFGEEEFAGVKITNRTPTFGGNVECNDYRLSQRVYEEACRTEACAK